MSTPLKPPDYDEKNSKEVNLKSIKSFEYAITLTGRDGLSDIQMKVLTVEMMKFSNNCLIVHECGKSGHFHHMQAVIDCKCAKIANVTRSVQGWYIKHDIEFVKYVSIKVKCCKNQLMLRGALHYASKELHLGTPRIVLGRKGWKQTWIDEQISTHLLRKKPAELGTQGIRVFQTTGGAVMYNYCLANRLEISCQQDFYDVGDQMSMDGYLFGTTRLQGIYQDVLALFGRSCFRQVAENALKWCE